MKKSPCINLFSHTYYAGMPKIAVKIKKSSPKSIVAKRNEKNIIAWLLSYCIAKLYQHYSWNTKQKGRCFLCFRILISIFHILFLMERCRASTQKDQMKHLWLPIGMYWLIKWKKPALHFVSSLRSNWNPMPGSYSMQGVIRIFYIPRSVCTRQEVFKQNGSIEKNWKIFLKTQVWSQSESWGWIIITNERNNIAWSRWHGLSGSFTWQINGSFRWSCISDLLTGMPFGFCDASKRSSHGGVCHCFCGTAELAKIYTGEFGLLLGIGGSLLQENQKELEEAVRETPAWISVAGNGCSLHKT